MVSYFSKMFSMCVFLLVFSSISTAVVGAPETVTGHRGERVDIRCRYESGYESNSKYFCKGECVYGFRDIVVKSGSPAEDERFSLTDDTRTRVFTVSITDLRTEDEGQYWCGVERTIADVYSEIMLLVKEDQIQQTTSITTTERKTTITDQDSSSTGDVWSTESVIYVSVGLVLVMIIFLAALTVLCRKRSKKPPRVTQSGLSPQVSIVLLSLNEHTAEEIDCNNPKHEDINKMKGKNKDIHTICTTIDRPEESSIYSTADKPDDSVIYSTADKPDDSMIYSTAECPKDSMIYSTADKPEDSMIYSTADKPEDSVIYSTADKPEDSMIYSTADKPEDSMIYSTADKPEDSMIYSTADKPEDSMIYSTADKPEDSMIYSTADKPEDSVIYSTADKPDDSMIYSTADKPDDSMIYSTADKPDDSMIYSTADKPDDSMIYSTADKPDDSVIYSTAECPDDSTS